MTIKRTLPVALLLGFFISVFGQEFPSPLFADLSSENLAIPGVPKAVDLAALNARKRPDSIFTATAAREDSALTGKFEIGDYIFADEHNNLIVYFNCRGEIVKKSCANFYRKGKMDSTNLSLVGPFRDYYINDTLAFDAHLENGLLNGPATYYHENGKVRSKGRYKENKRTGVWTYFYDNGKPDKIINFVRGFPFIVACNKPNGKQLVVQGNGEYAGKFMPDNSCNPYEIRGRVVKGKMDGKWMVYSEPNHQKVATEYYDNGKFIKRTSEGETYTGLPMISIHDFSPNEYLLWTENITNCPDERFQALQYLGKDLHEQFYPALLDSLHALGSDTLKDQWLIAGIQIARNSLVHSVVIKSSIDDQDTESMIYRIMKSMMHFSVIEEMGGTANANYFFTILFHHGKVIIPAHLYYKELMKSVPELTEIGDDS